ncbi:MAG: glutamate synthase subunit beta [Clostridiales bacterium]|nr:glutamate synthase subunit beta [Clostridiales bacterium]
MGKLFGFMEYQRELPPDRDPILRLGDWDEIHGLLPLKDQKEQAARCMNCAVPFCQSGMELKGVYTGCPLGNLIPEWNDLLYREEWTEAAHRLLLTNSFPEFTGRVCPALCEGACTCGINQPQITIRQNELSIIEHAFKSGMMTPQTPTRRTGKSVAVIGSGPAGLACAQWLNRYGHCVTVFERSDRIGGLLMYGIPNMKLDKKIVKRREELMHEEGIEFVTNCHIGIDHSADELRAKYDAVVLCCGSGKPRDLKAPGRESKGIAFALDYLTSATKQLLTPDYAAPDDLNAKNKHVIIIGGGDTGTDCVATALRQGAKSVHQLEIMPKLPSARTGQNPWPEFPKVIKVDYAQHEAIARFGDDPRQYLVQTSEFLANDSGHVSAVVTDNVTWQSTPGGRKVAEITQGTSKKWQADLVLIAMGFTGPEDTLVKAFGLNQDTRSNVAVDQYKTVCKGVFAAGDMHSGQSLVVRAINEGQEAATACHRYLTD